MDNELKDTLQIIVDKLGDIDNRLTNVENNQEIMKSDISGIKSDSISMKSDISGIKSDSISMKSDISGIKSDIEDLKIDSAVTRAGVNQLIEWADDASIHDITISRTM